MLRFYSDDEYLDRDGPEQHDRQRDENCGVKLVRIVVAGVAEAEPDEAADVLNAMSLPNRYGNRFVVAEVNIVIGGIRFQLPNRFLSYRRT